MRMHILVIGDRFMTNEILRKSVEERFKDSGVPLEFTFLQDEWPVENLMANEEVSEFCGNDLDIVPSAKDADAILTHSGCITKKVIDAAPNLKIIALARGGPVNVNGEAAAERKIPVTYAPGRNSGAVAEFTVGLILAHTRKIARSHYYLRYRQEWRGDFYAAEFVSREIGNSAVGIVGFGAIGKKVADILKAFGAKILIHDPYITEEVKAQYPDFLFLTLDQLLREADIVTLHTKFTSETERMIGKRELKLMKRSAVLINTARGQLVDHDALYLALEEETIAGAALDVFEGEPPGPDSKLYTLENVTATPHLGGASVEAAEIGARIAADELYGYLVEHREPRYWYNRVWLNTEI